MTLFYFPFEVHIADFFEDPVQVTAVNKFQVIHFFQSELWNSFRTIGLRTSMLELFIFWNQDGTMFEVRTLEGTM